MTCFSFDDLPSLQMIVVLIGNFLNSYQDILLEILRIINHPIFSYSLQLPIIILIDTPFSLDLYSCFNLNHY